VEGLIMLDHRSTLPQQPFTLSEVEAHVPRFVMKGIPWPSTALRLNGGWDVNAGAGRQKPRPTPSGGP
jgi:hypothetical protein